MTCTGTSLMFYVYLLCRNFLFIFSSTTPGNSNVTRKYRKMTQQYHEFNFQESLISAKKRAKIAAYALLSSGPGMNEAEGSALYSKRLAALFTTSILICSFWLSAEGSFLGFSAMELVRWANHEVLSVDHRRYDAILTLPGLEASEPAGSTGVGVLSASVCLSVRPFVRLSLSLSSFRC